MNNVEDIIRKIDSDKDNKLQKELRRYLKNWYWFVISAVVGGALSFFLYTQSPVTYEIKSRILAESKNEEINSLLSFNDKTQPTSTNTGFEDKIAILRSYSLFNKALRKLNWQTSWFEKGWFHNWELYNNPPFKLEVSDQAENLQNVPIEVVALNENTYRISAEYFASTEKGTQEVKLDKQVKFGQAFRTSDFDFILNRGYGAIGHPYVLVFNNLNDLTNEYLKKTNITSEYQGSNLINISIKGTNKKKEADFINELNDVFINFGVENRNISSNKSLEFIESQISRVKDKLQVAERNFSSYRKDKQVMNLSQEAQLIYQRLEKIENEKYLTEIQLEYYKNLQQYLDDSKKISEMVSPAVMGINDQGLTNMLSKLMELYNKRELLAYSVKEKNPSYQLLEKEITLERNSLDELLKNQIRSTESVIRSAEKRSAELEQKIRELPETEKNLIGIQREFDLNNEMYTYLMQKRAEASISKASIAPEVQVIDPALEESAKQLGPLLIRYLGTGIVGGLMLPFLIIALLGLFISKIETREEVEAAAHIPVLEGIVKHGYKSKLPVLQHPHSGISESFRGLKTNINTILNKDDCKVVSVNSLIPGEGKSFISSSLSAILAKGKHKVLLIGADLHKPNLQDYLEVDSSNGLSNYLLGEKSIEEITFVSPIPDLHIIHAGPPQENPSDLLDSDGLSQLVQVCRKKYDYIIIDNAPLLLIPDAISTSSFSDISLFILRLHHSHKDETKQINRLVGFNRIKNAAIVINGSPDRGYGYGKKYWKKGYGEYRFKMHIA